MPWHQSSKTFWGFKTNPSAANIRIDDYLVEKWKHPRKADVVSKVIGDFRGWENHAAYSKAFPRFLDALNRLQQGS